MPIDFKSCREEIAAALQEFCNRNKRSRGKRKNGNLNRKNKHVLTLSELSIIKNILVDI